MLMRSLAGGDQGRLTWFSWAQQYRNNVELGKHFTKNLENPHEEIREAPRRKAFSKFSAKNPHVSRSENLPKPGSRFLAPPRRPGEAAGEGGTGGPAAQAWATPGSSWSTRGRRGGRSSPSDSRCAAAPAACAPAHRRNTGARRSGGASPGSRRRSTRGGRSTGRGRRGSWPG